MSLNITLELLRDNKKNKIQLSSFYECSELFDDNLENLAIAMILVRKKIGSKERPNIVFKKVEEGKYHLLFDYCEYILSLPFKTEFQKLTDKVNSDREKILNKIFENKTDFPIFKRDVSGNIYKFLDEDELEVVFIKDDKLLKDDYKYDDSSLIIIPCDKERGLYNNQPVWCWNNGFKEKQLRFYCSYTKTAYSSYNNSIFDFNFDNYQALNLKQIEILDFMMEF